MPGNEVEDGICNLFEVDKSSQGQHLSPGVNGSWSVLNDYQWVGKQRQSVVPLNFNLQNYGVQQLDSLRGLGGESASVQYKPHFSTFTPRPENYRSQSRSYQLNTNGSLLGNQSFQTVQNQLGVIGEYMGYDQHSLAPRGLSTLKSQTEYESGTDSPTLTANSERSEITEVSTDFTFLRGKQQLARGHQPGISQPGQMQQSGYSDMQLLQQHMMFKQLQELQRQQQLQQLGDVRQQHSMNQLSAISKQAAGIQFSPLNGTPINNAAQMLMNWPQFGASSPGRGVANRLMFSPENGQPLRWVGHVPQPLDGSLYGTPVATARGNTGHYSQLQGVPQAEKHVMQPSGFSNPFVRDQFNVSPDQLSMLQGALTSSQGFPGKNMFGDVPNQGSNSGVLSGSFQEGNSQQTNTSVKEFSGRQEQTGWPVMQQKTMEHSPPLGLIPLDPVEEKILYNMDDTIWDASFGRRPDVGTAGIRSTLEKTDLANSFPSIQSGSWSALMQSAVAEASSSDTGLQEEWSGLTFQNTEQSTDNQLSNFMESDNQPTGWVDNNLQRASSFSSKPLHTMNDSSMSSSFPGFQQPGIQFPVELRQGLHQDGSHESMEKSQKVLGEWVDCNPRQKPSSASQQVQSLMHLNNALAGQVLECSEGEAHKQKIVSHKQVSQMNFSAVPFTGMDHQTTNQQALESNQSENLGRADIPVVDKEKEIMGRSSQQIGNRDHVHNKSFRGELETYEKQNSYFQSKTSNGSYNSKGLSGSEQGFSGQFNIFGNASGNSINLEQGHLPHLRGNSRASKEVPSKGDLTSVGSDGSNVAAQASQNMLELLHKVDQSRDDGSITLSGSADCNLSAKVSEAEIAKSGFQLYNQPFTSQAFGLRLSPPPQRLPNLSHFHTSQGLPQTVPYPNSRLVNSELGEKNSTWLAPPTSVQTLPSSHELSQKTQGDDRSNVSGQTGTSLFLNKHGNSASAYMSDPTNIRNQSHVQFRSGTPVASQSSQVTLQPTGSRDPLFNLSESQDSSQLMGTNHLDHQFPVLEAVQVSQPSVLSGMSKQGDISARPHNVWTNVPSQRPPTVLEHLKGSSNFPFSEDQSINSTVRTLKGGYGSSEFGMGSQQQISSEIIDASKHILDTGAPPGSLVAHSHQLDLNSVKNEDNHAHGAKGRNMASVGHSLESSPNLHQNYSLLDQVCAMKNVETDPIKKSSGVPHDSFPSRDANMMRFLTEDDPRVRALSQPALQDRPTNETVQFGQNNSQSQSRINNLVSNLLVHSQVNPHMAPSLWKQFETLKNEQMLSMYSAKVATGQLSIGKPSQSLQIRASVERVDTADAIQGDEIMPSTVATLAATEHISAPYVLPMDITSQSMAITRSKKRKSVTFEPRPWHKEVTEGSQRVQNVSMAEECWAQVTNRVIEKVEDEAEMTEEVQPVLRSKRRLILTTQLMQQLFFPAPKPILSGDVTSHHDSVVYFISRMALGDACNFICCSRNDLLVSMDNSNMTSEKLQTIEGTNGQQFSEVVDELSNRAQKLENDFQRVDKMASVVDIRVECQELERFAVINRFGKFHIRAQADTSGTSSSSGPTKPFLQRYVTALPMPMKLPEGLRCISL